MQPETVGKLSHLKPPTTLRRQDKRFNLRSHPQGPLEDTPDVSPTVYEAQILNMAFSCASAVVYGIAVPLCKAVITCRNEELWVGSFCLHYNISKSMTPEETLNLSNIYICIYKWKHIWLYIYMLRWFCIFQSNHLGASLGSFFKFQNYLFEMDESGCPTRISFNDCMGLAAESKLPRSQTVREGLKMLGIFWLVVPTL